MEKLITTPGTAGEQARSAADTELEERFGQFARLILRGERVAEVVGVGDHFINDVLIRAYQLYCLGDLARAETLVQGAIALDETQAYPHLLLGDIFLQNKDYERAAEEFERARSLDPKNGEVLAKLGEARLRLGISAEAKQALVDALRLLPQKSRHHKRSHILLEVLQDKEREAAQPRQL